MQFLQRFSMKEFVIVADSGLVSQINIDLFVKADNKYIPGARIGGESKDVRNRILQQGKEDKVYHK